MINFKRIFNSIRKNRVEASEGTAIENTNVATFWKAQERRWLYVCLFILGVLGIAIKLQGGSSGKLKHEEKITDEGRNIALSFDNMDGNKIWQNHFEDKLRSSQYELQEKVESLMRDMQAKEEEERKHREQEL